jgi:hypothetical protein
VFIERPVPGSITGMVFHDLDLDMQPDPGEGIAGVTVTLYPDANTDGAADNSTPVTSAVTNAQGQYSMPDIQVGHYVLVETTPAGMISIKDFDPSPDGDVVPNTNMNNDTLPVSITNAEVDAGNFFIDAPSGCPLIVTNDNDAGPGSFRHVLGCAMPGDTIQFHLSLAGAVIEINSETLVFENDVVVISALSPTVTMQSSINDLFAITPGVVVEIRDVHLISGISPAGAGAAIDNHGELYLHNVQIFPNPLLAQDEYLVRNHPGSHLEISGLTLIHE